MHMVFDQSPLMDGFIELDTIPQFQAMLGSWLANQVLDCARSGFAKAYLSHEQNLPYVRGRIQTIFAYANGRFLPI